MTESLSPFEMFLLSAAREYTEDEVSFVGFHYPMLASRIARRCHAPNLVVVYECGIVEDHDNGIMATSPSDLRSAVGSAYCGSSLDALYGWLGRGRVGRTVLEAPIVDRRGNVNTTVVGDYHVPTVRLPGSGGGTELAAFGRGLVLLCSSTSRRSFPAAVDYITSPGYLAAPGDRTRYGYPDGTGPQVLITPLGRFTIDDQTGIAADAIHEGMEWAQVRECFAWLPADQPDGVRRLPPPTAEEVKAVRSVLEDARTNHYTFPGDGRP